MLTDVALKNLNPRTRPFKVADRDGIYAHVSTSGLVTFRLDYRLNGRRETVLRPLQPGRAHAGAGPRALQ